MSQTQTIRVEPVVVIDVPLEDYMAAYGMSADEARADAPGHLQEAVEEAVRRTLANLGYGLLVEGQGPR